MKKFIDRFKVLLGSSPTADTKDKEKSKGFTLIELLIVIAVIGILAAVVLIAIDPIEQIARGNDSGTKSEVGQLGRSVQAYYATAQEYPGDPTRDEWLTDLVTSGDIKSIPSADQSDNEPGNCSGGSLESYYCYKWLGDDFIIYTRMESESEAKKVRVNDQDCQNDVLYVYQGATGKSGTICAASLDASSSQALE